MTSMKNKLECTGTLKRKTENDQYIDHYWYARTTGVIMRVKWDLKPIQGDPSEKWLLP